MIFASLLILWTVVRKGFCKLSWGSIIYLRYEYCLIYKTSFEFLVIKCSMVKLTVFSKLNIHIKYWLLRKLSPFFKRPARFLLISNVKNFMGSGLRPSPYYPLFIVKATSIWQVWQYTGIYQHMLNTC